MKRFSQCCLLIVIAGCNSRSSGPPNLPESASFGWKLKSITESTPNKIWRAEYQGPGEAHVDIYRVNSPLDMQQHWRAAAQTVTVFNRNYFVVIKWEGANRTAATALVGQIERSLPHSD